MSEECLVTAAAPGEVVTWESIEKKVDPETLAILLSDEDEDEEGAD